MFRKNLNKIIQGQNLSESEMSQMILDIFSGDRTDAQIGAFIAALATKGETFEELVGAARAMRKKAIKIQVSSPVVVDTVGTGGDRSNTFNISTTTAFVVAGCGITVAKHGNRSVSSKCGSADVLEALGVNLDLDPEIVEEAIEELGIGFLFAPKYHGAMKYAMAARQQVGIRSIFNMLGPLSNPAAANYQLLGVYAPALTEMFAQALHLLGVKKAFVVHGHDGLDEISICSPTRISELDSGRIKTFDLNPETYFEQLADPADLYGGDAQKNADITQKILAGQKGPRRNIVLLNASAALVAAGRADDFFKGITLAQESIDTGAAMDKLTSLVQFTRENG